MSRRASLWLEGALGAKSLCIGALVGLGVCVLEGVEG